MPGSETRTVTSACSRYEEARRAAASAAAEPDVGGSQGSKKDFLLAGGSSSKPFDDSGRESRAELRSAVENC